jgi:hypothetical protein
MKEKSGTFTDNDARARKIVGCQEESIEGDRDLGSCLWSLRADDRRLPPPVIGGSALPDSQPIPGRIGVFSNHSSALTRFNGSRPYTRMGHWPHPDGASRFVDICDLGLTYHQEPKQPDTDLLAQVIICSAHPG